MDHKYFECECSSPEHLLRLSYFEDEPEEVFVEVHLNPKFRWYKRVWHAVKYVFGYRSCYGDFDEFIWSPEMVEKVRNECNEFLMKNTEYTKRV